MLMVIIDAVAVGDDGVAWQQLFTVHCWMTISRNFWPNYSLYEFTNTAVFHSCACWWFWMAIVNTLYCVIPLSNKFSWNIRYAPGLEMENMTTLLSPLADLKMVFHEVLSAKLTQYFEYLVIPSKPSACGTQWQSLLTSRLWPPERRHGNLSSATSKHCPGPASITFYLDIACIPWNDTNTSPCHAFTLFSIIENICCNDMQR